MTPTVPLDSMAWSTTSLIVLAEPGSGTASVMPAFSSVQQRPAATASTKPATANAIISIGNSDSTLKYVIAAA